MDWKEIYDREVPALYSFLLARGCSPDLAEDLIHEVFVGALSAGTVVEQPRIYFFQAIRNALARSSRIRPLGNDISGLVAPGSMPEEREAINAALAKLPLEQREVVVMRIWYEHSFQEIGEALGIPIQTAVSRWRYGLKKLRELLHMGED